MRLIARATQESIMLKTKRISHPRFPMLTARFSRKNIAPLDGDRTAITIAMKVRGFSW